NKAVALNVIGDVEGCTAILYDDMIDTAGTLTQGAQALKESGAAAVYAFSTHPVLSGPAVSRIAEGWFDKVIVTDTIPLNEQAAGCSAILVLSVAELLGEAIQNIHEETSVSSLFI
ncbi:MAG: ribose-phosphate diphosphokinase, partial [Acidobacteria bacterium]|nr:ribose-phosphate diphosphokinase [Acidobacteriota bacterium]